MKVYLFENIIKEFNLHKQQYDDFGSEGIIYFIGNNRVIKMYEEPHRFPLIKKVIRVLMELDHPHINTPLDFTIKKEENEQKIRRKYLYVLYERMWEIKDPDFETIANDLLTIGKKTGFHKPEMEYVNRLISERGWNKQRGNIMGLIDAINTIKQFFPRTLDIHDKNIMQDKEGTWKIIDFM